MAIGLLGPKGAGGLFNHSLPQMFVDGKNGHQRILIPKNLEPLKVDKMKTKTKMKTAKPW